MDIVRKTEVTIRDGLLVLELEQINNEGSNTRSSHHFVQIGDGSSEDFRLALNTKEEQETFFALYDALEVIVQKLRGW